MFIVKVSDTANAILDAMKEIHSNESGNIIDIKLLDVEETTLEDKKIQKIFETKSKVIFLGGDHSISYSIGKAFLEHCRNENKKSCLILFDAHADCLNSSEPNSRSWLRKLIEAGFPSENVLIVGTRNLHQEEIKFLKEKKVITISMNSLNENISDICDTIMEFANGKELYLSIDIDIVDPVFAPATTYPETCGLTSRQFIYLIQRMKKIKTLRTIDLVEINEDGKQEISHLNRENSIQKEDKKNNNLTVKLAAKILSELV